MRGFVSITPPFSAKLQEGKRFLLKGRSWSQAYDDTMIQHFSVRRTIDGQPKFVVLDPGERPSLNQFKYWVRKCMNPGEVERVTKGEAAYARNREERSGSSREAVAGPGSVFQIDATLANIYLRSRLDPDRLVGRPVLYIVTDQSTGLIVGFATGFAAPSWEMAKLAFENAFTDKVASCALAGVEIVEADWPPHHLCSQATGDRAWDVLGRNLGAGALGLGIHVANLPPYRPDLKSLVEGKFELLDASSIKWAPGATHGRVRGDPDDRVHELDGFYDLPAFREFMIHSIIRHNATQVVARPPRWYPMQEGGSPTLNELWNYGCRHQGAPRWLDGDQIRANLLHIGEAKRADDGLHFGRLSYVAASEERRGELNRAHGRTWGKVEVRHDPRDVSSILVPVQGGGFEVFRLSPGQRRFDGYTSDEVKLFFSRRVAMDAIAEGPRLQHDLRFRENIAALNAKARRTAANARSNAATAGTDAGHTIAKRGRIRLSGNKELMARENRDDQRDGAWTHVVPRPQGLPPQPETFEAPAAAPVRQASMVKLKPDRTALLRGIRDEAIDQSIQEEDYEPG